MKLVANTQQRERKEIYGWLVAQAKQVKQFRPATMGDLNLEGNYHFYTPAIYQVKKAKDGVIDIADIGWAPFNQSRSGAYDLPYCNELTPYEKSHVEAAIELKSLWVNVKPWASKTEQERERNLAHKLAAVGGAK